MAKKLLLPLLSVAILSPWAVAQEPATKKEVEELRQRIDDLEDEVANTSEKVGGRAIVQAYTARTLDFGGHVTSLFTHIRGENDSATGHMVSLVELFVRAKIDDEWSMFATPGFYTFNGALLDNPATFSNPSDPLFTRDSASAADTFLSRIYGQWKHSDRLTVQAGIVGSPHGTTNREYFIPARLIASGSLHTRYFMGNQLYPQLLEGVKASGKLQVGDGTNWVDYDVYFGVQDTSADDPMGGARIAYVFGDLGLSVGANYGRGTRMATATPATNFGGLQSPVAGSFNTTRDYQFGGIDIDWRSGDFISKTEAYYSAEDGFEDQRAFSSELSYFVDPQWAVSYRFDYFDSGEDFNVLLSAVAPRGHDTEHVIGLSYNPNSSVRIRLDLHHNNLPNTDDSVDFVNLSWSFSF